MKEFPHLYIIGPCGFCVETFVQKDIESAIRSYSKHLDRMKALRATRNEVGYQFNWCNQHKAKGITLADFLLKRGFSFDKIARSSLK